MDAENIKLRMEEFGIEPTFIDEVVKMISVNKSEITSAEENKEVIADLQKQINEEKDWRKRAALVAGIISLKMDNY